jgi:hypothetical protein
MMRRLLACAALIAITACAASSEHSAPHIAPPPAALALDPFYTKNIDAVGIPISASDKVPDDAMLAARRIVVAMLAHRPDLARALVDRGQRIAIMGVDEGTVDLPEQRDWKKPAIDDPRLTFCERKHYEERIGRLTDAEYWNKRARGMGGELTSAATENLLGTPGTRYYGENILVHEFAHAILAAVRSSDPALYARVERAYADAIAAGKWTGEYASVNADEYWAEGTQFWFNSNKVAVVDEQHILSDSDMARYDPTLAEVLHAVYGARHKLPGDIFHDHAARVPPGGPPKSTAEIC